ncbi:hypothetical protein DH2020_040418 [Rehmannia glutinosa]|uniref:AP2/ERF domain-containing protein n=1 Tax=Rehmannia glutinosa TaxID=99300 RepID=A0ABR0UT07_REHGL
MAPESNWLSFSVSSMEMLNYSSSSSSQQPAHDSQHYYSFADNFYATGWPNQKAEAMFTESENHHVKEHNNASIFTGYMHPPPKLEDFFSGGGESTETQDSSLTHIYDHNHGGAAYFSNGEQQDLKTIIGFQAFSANSGSEVDDSAFAGQTRSPPVESAGELVTYSQCPITTNADSNYNNGLSLGGNINSSNNNNNKEAIIAVSGDDTESCKKIGDTFGQRTSIYRGVTRHRWTGRYEAHLWDNSCRREGQARKGRQVYLGGYDKEEKAARAYDLAALKYWGPTATTNFPIANYTKETEEMKHVTKQEFIASLRRHHQQGRWQARIGRVAGNKDLYLGTFGASTEEEAAEAYDIAAIKFRGVNAVTNFEMSRYDVEAIANSPLPIGGTAKRLKLSLEAEEKLPLTTTALQTPCSSNSGGSISFAAIQPPPSAIPCGVPLDNSSAPFYHHNLFHHLYNPAGSDTSMATHPMSFVPSAGEFFIWPHQSY